MNTVYARFLRRWWWLTVIAVTVSLMATHYAIGQQKPLYRAQATIQVGRTIQDKNPEQNEFAVMDRLVPAYAELAKRDPILIATAQTLQLPLSPDELRLRLLVTRVPSAPLIDIIVVDTDPQRAAALANEIARQVVLQSPATSQQDQSAQEFIRQQLTDLQRKITDSQAEITALQNRIATLTSASDIEEAKRQLNAVEAQAESWQSSYARLVSAAEPSKVNLVSLLSPAVQPAAPIPGRDTLYYALALVIGAGLSILLALALDVLTRAVTAPDDLEAIGDAMPILTIPQYRVPRQGGPLISVAPSSPAAAAYRLLRNTLSASADARAGTTIAVTSSRVAEGKTTTVSNLAIALANAGRRVVLVDANLHNPEIDALFGVAPVPGFSDLLLGDCALHEVMQQAAHPNLTIVAAGSVPNDYADLLSMSKVGEVIGTLARAADVVLFDSPAIAQEQDALLLTRHVEEVLVVVEAGRANMGELQGTITLLKRTDVRVAAIALNKVRPPRLNPGPLPWSREARNRARAKERRRVHARGVIGAPAIEQLREPGD